MGQNMHYRHLCLSCYMEQREVYKVEAVNQPPIRRECDGCGKKRQVWKYRVEKITRRQEKEARNYAQQ